MANSRFHYAQTMDSPSIRPFRDPRTSRGRRLSVAEIRRLYPGVPIAGVSELPRRIESRRLVVSFG